MLVPAGKMGLPLESQFRMRGGPKVMSPPIAPARSAGRRERPGVVKISARAAVGTQRNMAVGLHAQAQPMSRPTSAARAIGETPGRGIEATSAAAKSASTAPSLYIIEPVTTTQGVQRTMEAARSPARRACRARRAASGEGSGKVSARVASRDDETVADAETCRRMRRTSEPVRHAAISTVPACSIWQTASPQPSLPKRPRVLLAAGVGEAIAPPERATWMKRNAPSMDEGRKE